MTPSSATRLSLAAAACAVILIGCVPASKYNNMVKQRDALEASLRSEISADQVKIEQLENGIRVRMSDGLLYRSGSTELHPTGKAALDKASAEMSKMAAQGFQIDVTGNTDSVPIGAELATRYPTNWELAGARASIVVRYLQEKGLDPSQLLAISAGQYHPVASNDTPEGRAANRRTDIVLRPTN
jgi:chemotaxis protein MotB